MNPFTNYLASSIIKGTLNSIGGNGKDIYENTIDEFFDPLIEIENKIRSLF